MRIAATLGIFALISAAQAAAPKYTLQADVVRGAVNAQGAVCVQNSVFYPGEGIVWRVNVMDAATGKTLTPAQVKAAGLTVAIKVDNGVIKQLEYLPHPPTGDNQQWFFAGAWQTVEKTPTGTLKWTATARDKAGNTATFSPIGQDMGLAALTIAPKK